MIRLFIKLLKRLSLKMQIKLRALWPVFLLMLLPVAKAAAQPIPIGDLRDDQFRTLQLLSDSTITTSLMNRPVWYESYRRLFNESNTDAGTWYGYPFDHPEKTFSVAGYKMRVGGYEPVIKNTYNSALPYGGNNGAAWYGKGWNNELQGGFYITSKYISVTLRPDFIYTQNEPFDVPEYVPRYNNGDVRYVNQGQLALRGYKLANRIDRPFRFGPDSYGTIDWGQSSVRLHYKQLEAGVSKGNLWWGPGVQNALAMSNNAPGLRHAFLGTRSPVNLPFHVGKIEFRWIFGWPQDSQYFDLNIYGAPNYINRFEKYDVLQKKRFLNGINIVYTPSFLPNLSLGASRVVQQYVPDGGLSFGDDILGVFKAFPKPTDGVYKDYRDDSHFEQKDPVASVFFRWVLPESDAEFYGEYYKGDHNVNTRDFLTEPQHGRAYTLGVQKLLEFDGALNFLKVNAEINSTAQGPIDELRPQTYLYTHATIQQGYTNGGQILGASIGPGSQSQYLGVDGYFDQGKVGLFVQREVLNNNFYYERFDRYAPQKAGFKDLFHHRVNLNLGLRGTYKISSLLLNGSVTWNRNYNYGRHEGGGHFFFTSPVPIVDNFQYQLSLRYLF